jgi:hypothetical protein
MVTNVMLAVAGAEGIPAKEISRTATVLTPPGKSVKPCENAVGLGTVHEVPLNKIRSGSSVHAPPFKDTCIPVAVEDPATPVRKVEGIVVL